MRRCTPYPPSVADCSGFATVSGPSRRAPTVGHTDRLTADCRAERAALAWRGACAPAAHAVGRANKQNSHCANLIVIASRTNTPRSSGCCCGTSNTWLLKACVWLQVVYLTTDSPTVTLKRRRSATAAGAPPAFSASATVPFVPSRADALSRWKHYLFRAFAGRHLLALTAAAGTPAEHAALGDFHTALAGLLPRVCRSGGLGGAPVPMSDEDVLLVEEIDRSMQCAPCIGQMRSVVMV